MITRAISSSINLAADAPPYLEVNVTLQAEDDTDIWKLLEVLKLWRSKGTQGTYSVEHDGETIVVHFRIGEPLTP